MSKLISIPSPEFIAKYSVKKDYLDSELEHSSPEYVGSFPVRTEIEVLPANEPRQLKLGWTVTEMIGVAVVNPRGVSHVYFEPNRSYDDWVGEVHKSRSDQMFRELIARDAKRSDFDGLEQVLKDRYPNYLPIYNAARIMK